MNTSLNHALEKEVKHSKGVLLEELKTTMKTLEAAETAVFSQVEQEVTLPDGTKEKQFVTGPIPEYSIISISGYYQISQKINIFFSGKNITDEIYIGSRLHSNPGQKDANISSGIIPVPRRHINIGLEYSF